MQFLNILLLIFILVCAIAVALSRNLLVSIVIFMSQSLAMSVIWIMLQSPDLAITEAAVGAGITSLLLFVTLKKIHAIDQQQGANAGKDPALQAQEQNLPADAEHAMKGGEADHGENS